MAIPVGLGRGWVWGFVDLLRDGVDVGLSAYGADYPAAAKAKADVSSGAGDRDGLSFLAVDMAVWMDIRVSGVPGCEG